MIFRLFSFYLKSRADTQNVVRVGIAHVGCKILPRNGQTVFWNGYFVGSRSIRHRLFWNPDICDVFTKTRVLLLIFFSDNFRKSDKRRLYLFYPKESNPVPGRRHDTGGQCEDEFIYHSSRS